MFRGSFFQLLYPAHWEEEIIEDIPAFYDPEGSGVLQVVALRNKGGGEFDLAMEMERYLKRHSIQYDKDVVARFPIPSGLNCMACEFMRENRFWLVNLVAHADKMLIVLYNADEAPDVELARMVSEVIRSVVFY